MRNISKLSEDWRDYTTLEEKLLRDTARFNIDDMTRLEIPGFTIKFYNTLRSFYLAEALEYVQCWQQATDNQPAGICGPIGPTEQLPLVAQIVNDLEIDIRHGHFWGVDKWYLNGKELPLSNPISFPRNDLELCFNRIKKKLVMTRENIHFSRADNIDKYSNFYDSVKNLIIQGGQGDVKHWTFNDPIRRERKYKDNPPSPEEYRKLGTRIVDIHPMTVIQNARTSGGGFVSSIPSQAITVGPVETWKSGKISIWHAGNHDNQFRIRLTTFIISRMIQDSSVPMSLLTDHPNVQFNFYIPGTGTYEPDMH